MQNESWRSWMEIVHCHLFNRMHESEWKRQVEWIVRLLKNEWQSKRNALKVDYWILNPTFFQRVMACETSNGIVTRKLSSSLNYRDCDCQNERFRQRQCHANRRSQSVNFKWNGGNRKMSKSYFMWCEPSARNLFLLLSDAQFSPLMHREKYFKSFARTEKKTWLENNRHPQLSEQNGCRKFHHPKPY